MSLHVTQRSHSQSNSSHEKVDPPLGVTRGEFLRVTAFAALSVLGGGVPCSEVSESSRSLEDQHLDVEPLLNRLQATSIEYFIRNRQHGLVLDQVPVANWPYSSMAATGFGLASYVIGVERGALSRARAVELVDETLRTIETESTLRHRGWFTHFVDVSDQ